MSQWADRERRLSPEASAEPGQWDTSRAEYLRGVMDAISDPTVTRVVVAKGSQVGYTECLGNIIGFHIDQDPAPILVVQPTVEMAEAWSKDRLAPMIRDTPCLAGKVQSPLTRDSGNTLRQKVFTGGRLAIVGANSPAGLASRPVRIVVADEVDRFPVSAGSEGDPLALASKRQGTFWNRKTLVGSTPTLKETSAIWREWLASDMRHYQVPCHACGQRKRWCGPMCAGTRHPTASTCQRRRITSANPAARSGPIPIATTPLQKGSGWRASRTGSASPASISPACCRHGWRWPISCRSF